MKTLHNLYGKKLLVLPILLLLALSLLNALNVNITGVSAVESPYIAVVPETIDDTTLTPGKNFTISIYTDYVGTSEFTDYIHAYQFALTYNPNVLNGVEVVNGDLIVGGTSDFIAGPFDNEAGELSLTVGYYDVAGEVTSGPGTLANVTFTVVGTGASDITIDSHSKLIGWNWFGDPNDYDIINAEEQPDQIQHGYFSNVPPTQYTLTIAVDGFGTTDPVPGPHVYDAGTEVSVDAVPDSGYMLDHWELDGVPDGAVDPYTVIMNDDYSLTASVHFDYCGRWFWHY